MASPLTLNICHTPQGETAGELLSRSQCDWLAVYWQRCSRGGFVMLAALWLVLGALVCAKVVVWRRNRARDELAQALERQIYRLHHLAAMAKEDETFRELRAMARGER